MLKQRQELEEVAPEFDKTAWHESSAVG